MQNKSYIGNDDQTQSPHIPAFAPLISDGLEFIKSLPVPVKVAKGTILIHQDEPIKTIYLIRQGLVKLTYLSDSGQDVTLGLRTEGWYAGCASVLLNVPSVYTVETVTTCTVSRIPAREFSLYLMQNPKVIYHCVTVLCQELTSQMRAQTEVMASSAEDRLDHFMREREAQSERWRTLDPLPFLKQMDIAKLLGVTPEHLSRLIHKRTNVKQAEYSLAGRRLV